MIEIICFVAVSWSAYEFFCSRRVAKNIYERTARDTNWNK